MDGARPVSERFLILIDESGDTNVTNVRAEGRPGASDYFVMGAAVVPYSSLDSARQMLDEFDRALAASGKKWKHTTDLNHSQKVLLCRSASNINARYFSLISRKETLGSYRGAIGNNPHKFYNKCVSYILEKCCTYLRGKGAEEDCIDVICEERNHDYDAMRRFLGKIKDRPMYEEYKSLSILNPFGIKVRKKAEEPLLRLADIVSFATYSCVNKTPQNYCIPEARYLREISKSLGADAKGNVLGIGLKCIHSIDELNLDPDIKSELEKLRAFPLRRSAL